ncbi:hypothetical protein Esti_003533 [Eimeria stiedai]
MHGVHLQSLRLLAALPLHPRSLGEAFDLDDVVQRRAPPGEAQGRGGARGGPNPAGGAPGCEPLAEFQGRMKGIVIRTPRGIQDCSQDLDPEHMDPESDEVQVAWEDGTVENVHCRDLQLVDRCLFVGDAVVEATSGTLGLVLEVQQALDVAIPIEAFKTSSAGTHCSSEASPQQKQQQEKDAVQSPQRMEAAQQLPSRLSGLQVRVMGAPTLSLEPPVLQQLQQFNEGMPVVCEGRMGCVISGKVDYVVALDSGHEFTFEEGMVGVRPEPRRGHPMSWVSGLYPSLPVYATGELISQFQTQVTRASAAAAAADPGRLCKGFVKSFAIRNVKVAWQLQGPLTAAGSHRILAPWTEHDPSELLPLQQPIMRLGQPVYVDVRRVQQQMRECSEGGSSNPATGAAAAAAAFGNASYTVGVVDKLQTLCTVLWETGVVEKDVRSHRLTPVAIDRTPLSPSDCHLEPLLLPHMVVQRRRPNKQNPGPLHQRQGLPPSEAQQQQASKLPWWLHLHFGGFHVGDNSCVDPHLAAARRDNESARVLKEVAFALGADEGSAVQADGSNSAALLDAAASRRRAAADQTSSGEAAVGDSSGTKREEGGPPSKGPLDRNGAYEAARLSLPLLLRFMKEAEVSRHLLELPRERFPLLRRGTSAVNGRHPPRSCEGASPGDDFPQATPEDIPGPQAVQADEANLLLHEAQTLAAEIFSFEGGPSLDAVASFLHLVYSHGQWGGSARDAMTEKNLQQIFEAVALVVGDTAPEALMDPAPQREAPANVELGIVVYVHRNEKNALVAWIKDTQQFATRLREEHAEYFAQAAQDPYRVPPPLEQIMRSLGITPFTSGKAHSVEGPDVLSIYNEAEGNFVRVFDSFPAGRLKEPRWRSLVDLSWEPYGAISVQPQHLFFPGDLAVVRPDRLPEAAGLPNVEGRADTRVFVEVVGFCGGSLWARTLDGVMAPFLPSDLLPLIFRRLEDLLDTSSEEGSEYSQDGSEAEDGEWEDDDSGSDSTDITSLSRQSELSRGSESP